MFTRPDQLQRKGGPEERFSYLQKLKNEYNTTKSLVLQALQFALLTEAKQQVLANLANFAYDPINYAFIKQLQIADLFVSQLHLRQSEELCAYAVGGLCNLSNDPEIARHITTEATINILSELLQHENKEIALNSLTTLYYLAGSRESAHVVRIPKILTKLRSFQTANLDDSRLCRLATIFLSDIWGPDVATAHSKPTESVEVSTHSSRDYKQSKMGATFIRRAFCNAMSIAPAGHREFCATRAGAKCSVGDTAVSTRRITKDDVRQFARMTGDTNPIHLPQDDEAAAVVHGAFLNGLVSCVIGTQLPGAGTLVAFQSLNFPQACYAGEHVTTTVEVVDVRKIIYLKYACKVQQCSKTGQEKCVLHGVAKVVQR